MAVLTGAHGELRYEGRKIGKARDWSLNISRDALEDSCIGTDDRTYVKGLRGAVGAATVLYDPADSNTSALLNSIFDNNASDDLDFVFTSPAAHDSAAKLSTSVSHPVTTGDVQAVACSFQVNGQLTGVTNGCSVLAAGSS